MAGFVSADRSGLGLYTAASLGYVTFGMPYTDPFWCSAFWALAQAVTFAPSEKAKPIDAVIVPSRYGLSMGLIAAVAGIHLIASVFTPASHQLQELRVLLTLGEVVALMVHCISECALWWRNPNCVTINSRSASTRCRSRSISSTASTIWSWPTTSFEAVSVQPAGRVVRPNTTA